MTTVGTGTPYVAGNRHLSLVVVPRTTTPQQPCECGWPTQRYHLCVAKGVETPLEVGSDTRQPLRRTRRRSNSPVRNPIERDPRDILRAIHLYHQGATIRSIAAQLHWGTAAVSRVLKDNRVELRTPGNPDRVPVELRQQAVADYICGATIRTLAAREKVHTDTVRKWLQDAGVPPRLNDLASRPHTREPNRSRVVELVAEGSRTQREIAAELGIGLTTVERILRTERDVS